MKAKITQADKYALNISEAYTHKTCLGGIFTILYILFGFALLITIILFYYLQKDQISSKLLIDYSLPIAPIDDKSFYILGTATLLHSTSAADIIEFNQYFRFFASVKLSTSQQILSILPCQPFPYTNSNQCQFTISPSDYHDKVNDFIEKDAMHFGYMSCKTIIDLSKLQILIVINKELLEGCIEDIDAILMKDYMKGVVRFEFDMPYHYFTYPVIKDKLDVKKYKVDNRIGKSYHQRYSMNMNLCNVQYDNDLWLGRKYDKTFYNWIEPERINSIKRPEGHSLTIVLSNRNKTRIVYYTIFKMSLLSIFIDFGGFFRIYAMLVAIPFLWHGYMIEKALLILCSLFNLKKLDIQLSSSSHDDNNKHKTSLNDSSNSIKEDFIESAYDWRKYTYGMYIRMKYCWCCCCSCCFNKSMKVTKDKILKSMEVTSFVKFGPSYNWVDIAKYMPDYTSYDRSISK